MDVTKTAQVFEARLLKIGYPYIVNTCNIDTGEVRKQQFAFLTKTNKLILDFVCVQAVSKDKGNLIPLYIGIEDVTAGKITIEPFYRKEVDDKAVTYETY